MWDDRSWEEKELEKSWLISYSDLFTLLFVIILIVAAAYSSVFQVRQKEWQELQEKKQAEQSEVEKNMDLLALKKLELQREISRLEKQRDDIVAEIMRMQETRTIPPAWEQTDLVFLADDLQKAGFPYEVTTEGLMIRLDIDGLLQSDGKSFSEAGRDRWIALGNLLRSARYTIVLGSTMDWQEFAPLAAEASLLWNREAGIPAKRLLLSGKQTVLTKGKHQVMISVEVE